jgi:hypothetical protein
MHIKIEEAYAPKRQKISLVGRLRLVVKTLNRVRKTDLEYVAILIPI